MHILSPVTDNCPSWISRWLVGCVGLNGLLRQYFSLYRTVSQRKGERKEKWQTREKMSKQPTSAPTASVVGPCPTIIQINRMPRHWKFTQHHRSTRPPPPWIGGRRNEICGRTGYRTRDFWLLSLTRYRLRYAAFVLRRWRRECAKWRLFSCVDGWKM